MAGFFIHGILTYVTELWMRKNGQHVKVKPNASTTYTADRDVELPVGDAAHILVSRDSADDLTNKTVTLSGVNKDRILFTNASTGKIEEVVAPAANQVLKRNAANDAYEFAAAGGDVSASATLNDNRLIRGDGASKNIQESGITVTDGDVVKNVHGIITTDNSSESVTLLTGETLTHPFLDIESGHTYTINGQLLVHGELDMETTGVLEVGTEGLVEVF